jgi:hypothetical protein
VLNVVLQGVRRADRDLRLRDLLDVQRLLSAKMFVVMFINDIILASPIAVAQALLASDFVWAVIYFVFGFLLNWLFGFGQLLLFEDQNLSILSCFVWSAASALDPATFSSVLISYVVVFFVAPLIVTTPFVLVFHVLVFFELFGSRLPAT